MLRADVGSFLGLQYISFIFIYIYIYIFYIYRVTGSPRHFLCFSVTLLSFSFYSHNAFLLLIFTVYHRLTFFILFLSSRLRKSYIISPIMFSVRCKRSLPFLH